MIDRARGHASWGRRVKRHRMREVRAVEHGGGVAGLVLEPDGRRLDPVREPRHHRQRADRQSRQRPARSRAASMVSGVRCRPDERLARLLVRLGRHPPGPRTADRRGRRTRRRRPAAPRPRTTRCTPGRRPPATARPECPRCRRSSPDRGNCRTAAGRPARARPAVNAIPAKRRRRPRPCSHVSFTEWRRCSTIPTPRNSAALTQACPATATASPASPSGVSNANPARNIPEWLTVENASSRLTWRSRKQNSAPTMAVMHAEHQEQVARSRCGARARRRTSPSRPARSRRGRARPSPRRTARRPASARPRARRPARSGTGRSPP